MEKRWRDAQCFGEQQSGDRVLNEEIREARIKSALPFHIVSKNCHSYKSTLWLNTVFDLPFWNLRECNTWCGWSLGPSAHWWLHFNPLLFIFSSSWKMKSTERSGCDTFLLVVVIEEWISNQAPIILSTCVCFHLQQWIYSWRWALYFSFHPGGHSGDILQPSHVPHKNCQWVRSEDFAS